MMKQLFKRDQQPTISPLGVKFLEGLENSVGCPVENRRVQGKQSEVAIIYQHQSINQAQESGIYLLRCNSL
jgi:hypothetical protein